MLDHYPPDQPLHLLVVTQVNPPASSLTTEAGNSLLQKNVELVRVAEISGSTSDHHLVSSLHLTIRAYKLFSESSSVDVSTGDDNEDDDAAVAKTFRMPSANLEGLWESLHFDTDIKSILLQFMTSAILFGDRGVNHNFISWNRFAVFSPLTYVDTGSD